MYVSGNGEGAVRTTHLSRVTKVFPPISNIKTQRSQGLTSGYAQMYLNACALLFWFWLWNPRHVNDTKETQRVRVERCKAATIFLVIADCHGSRHKCKMLSPLIWLQKVQLACPDAPVALQLNRPRPRLLHPISSLLKRPDPGLNPETNRDR